LVTRALFAVLLACAVTQRGAAQVLVADSAFVQGDFAKARSLYETVLAADSLNERALWRLALLDSWDGLLDRSIARFEKARQIDPSSTDLMVAEARVLSWANRTASAVALYDSALDRDSGRVDALAGRAQSVAWMGDLDKAERLWRAALASYPEDASILVGLAQTLYWKGEPSLAATYLTRARAIAPDDPTARDLQRQVNPATRPEVGGSLSGSNDSDHESSIAQDVWFSGTVSHDIRGTVSVGWRHDTDLSRSNSSYGIAGAIVTGLGSGAVLRAGLGARQLAPDSGGGRTPLTAVLGVSVQPLPYAAVGLAYTRSPFDETAALIDHGYTIDNLDLSIDVSPKAAISISGGAGATWISDGNRRFSGIFGILGGLGHGLSVGVLARIMGYRTTFVPSHGYFAPDRFSLLEARAVYNRRRGAWGFRADGGLGVQQVFSGASAQGEWHADASIFRTWGAGEISLEGFLTNSAASSTLGAYRYGALTLGVRQGL
jgi:tetratricopeptide (TPR) repeat protein